MIRTGNRDLDIYTAERVIKKVLNPGVETAKIIDRFGLPLPSPRGSGIAGHQSYVLSPRGVPTMVASSRPLRAQAQAYKYEMMPPNHHKRSGREDIQRSHTMVAFSSNKTKTAPTPSNMNMISKKRAISSSPVRPMQQSKGIVRERHLSSIPLDSKNMSSLDHWNISPQSMRLEKEWSAVSKCRALKRTSEIVNHRVDPMYFMSGSQIKLQPRYNVDDDELRRLQELSRTRQNSRQHSFVNEDTSQAVHFLLEPTKSPRSEPIKSPRSELTKSQRSELTKSPRPVQAWQQKLAWQLPHEPQPMSLLPGPQQKSEQEPSAKPNTKSEMDQITDEHQEASVPIIEGLQSAERDNEIESDLDESLVEPIDNRSVSRIDIRMPSPEGSETGLNIMDILSHDVADNKEDFYVELWKKYPSLSKNARMLLRLEHEAGKKYSTNGLKRRAIKTQKPHKKGQNLPLPEGSSPQNKENHRKSSIVTVKYGISINPKKRKCQPDLYRLPKYIESSTEHPLADCECRKNSLPIRLTVNGHQFPIQSKFHCL